MPERELLDERNFSHPNEDLLFSLDDGFVWASWPGTTACVRLGRQDAVIAGMYEFLAQCEVAKRLENPEAGD